MSDGHWTLEDLFSSDVSDKPPPTTENLLQLLSELHAFWKSPDTNVNGLVQWACDRFDVSLDETFKFDTLQNNVKWRVVEIEKLHNLMKIHDVYAEHSIAKEQRDDILYIIRDARDCIFRSACLYHRLDCRREATLPDNMTSTEHFFNFDDSKNTSFQNLVLHVLELLRIAEYRRMDDWCYEQVFTGIENGEYATHAWEPKCRITDFLHENIRKEVDFQQWRNLTNPRDNAKWVAEHLSSAQHTEFPTILPDRFKWSYRNGIYDIEKDFFWPFYDRENWKQLSEKLVEYRRENGWGENYDLIPPTSDTVVIKYFDIDFRPYGQVPDPVSFQRVQSLIDKQELLKATNDTLSEEEEQEIEILKEEIMDIQRMDAEKEANFDPFNDLKTSDFDKIMFAQNLEGEVLEWVMIFLGRCLFPVSHFDKWQVILFVKGVAGSGKSTLAKLLRRFFPNNLVSTLSANIEKQFGLSAIYKSLLCVCSEVREDFGLNQADWQSAASGEEVSVAIKGQTAISMTWKIPMFFAGNELPRYTNAAGSVDRRIFMVEFNRKITTSDPFLYEKIENNFDLFHRKIVTLYLRKVREIGHQDIWEPGLLPKELTEFRERMRRAVDPLMAYLDSGIFTFSPSLHTELKGFKDGFSDYVRENNLERKRWCPDFYTMTFQDKGIIIMKKRISRGGVTSSIDVMTGIGMTGDSS